MLENITDNTGKEEESMGKYTEDAKELLQYVGGKENVGAVAHCMTRMRFVLNDPRKADISKIEEIGRAHV